jgi:hypothetical protein
MTRGLVVLALVIFWHNAFNAFAEAASRLPNLA